MDFKTQQKYNFRILYSFSQMMSRQQPARTYQPITTSLQQKKGALQELKERGDIVIKSADKGSAVVVMDNVDYLEEVNRQLTNQRFYKKTGL